MAAVDFPENPSASAVHRDGAKTWRYDGTTWKPTTVTQIGAGQVAAANLATTSQGVAGQVLTRGSGTSMDWASASAEAARSHEMTLADKVSGDREETATLAGAGSAVAFRIIFHQFTFSQTSNNSNTVKMAFQLGDGTTWQEIFSVGKSGSSPRTASGIVDVIRRGSLSSWLHWGYYSLPSQSLIGPSNNGTLSKYTQARMIITGDSSAYLANGATALILY